MMRPEMLDFGESEAILEIGVEIQTLTPSFLGDAPSSWAVNPPLPDGITLDSDSGVISGTPVQESSPKSYTVIASNAMGVSSFRLQITVLPHEIISIELQSEELYCTRGETCHLETPSFTGGTPDKWSCDPPPANGYDVGR
tara:strand:- start:156 stop:578 length:423 start_codon:yes stop_codon:yes gene_type:complete